jgi:murein DD-endopeptidase MepM/ murein hydrolase activator NlpD
VVRARLYAAFTLYLIGGVHAGFRASAQIPPSVGVVLDVPAEPTPVKADGKAYLLYELHITNFRDDSLELSRLEVLSDDGGTQPLHSYDAADLESMLARPGIPDKNPNRRIIGSGSRAVVFLTVAVTPASTPAGLRHRLFFRAERQYGGDFTLEAARIPVRRDAPFVIRAPLRGGGWVAGNILTNASDHRRAIIPIDGQARIAQRYAIDWIKMGEDGKAFRDDPRTNTNWYGYGADVLAVANGTVVEAKDDAPDNVFFVLPKPIDNLLGNYVSLDLGKRHCAVYAHLQPGSINVSPGQRVRQGHLLGLLGNSGKSPVPHLHFHMTNSSPFGEGVPYVFDSFVVQGSAESFDALMTGGGLKGRGGAAVRRFEELPVNYAVVSLR